MIRILEYGQVKNDEIFARDCGSVNVEDKVEKIIEDVKSFL